MKFVLEPKQDITAFELAHIIAASSMGLGHDPAWHYLSQKCPTAIRHIRNMNQSVYGDDTGEHPWANI